MDPIPYEDLPSHIQFHKVIDAIGMRASELISGAGMIINFVLILAILFKTPKHMRIYAILLLNFAFFDFTTSIASYMACQKPFFSGTSLIYVFLGPCKYISPSLCYFCHCFVCHSMSHSQWILMMSFMFRRRVLKTDHPSVLRTVLVLFGLYMLSFWVFVFYFLDIGSSDELLETLNEIHPEYHYKDPRIWPYLVVSGNTNIFSLSSIVAIIYMTLPCVPIYIYIHYARKTTLNILSTMSMSAAVKKSHTKLIQALTIQAAIPIFWLVASGMYILSAFRLLSGPVTENVIFRLMDCIPTLTPIVSFVFIVPYREAVLRFMPCCRRGSKKANNAVEAVSSKITTNA